VVVEGGVGLEGLVDFGEVAAHAWTVVGQRAAGVDEGDEDELAAELLQADFFVGLIEEGEVGDGVADGGHVILDRGFVVGASLGDDDDVF